MLQKYANDFPGTLANLKRASITWIPPEASDFLTSTISEAVAGTTAIPQAVDKINQKWLTLEVPPLFWERAQADGQVAR